ncbi:Transposon Ty3-I Gag-Pol polyprotein [Gossypium australe]|uniref:Transposon Ty3-I Gag-Pol polyprotein n=1 Tax=Gossypium australe TaxID=47621 RepID=A0A5B6UZR1_9ROSI|nr:Transposon Ty3-I Gag-Pol polyprotein [Gossypium australe]
MEDNPWREGKEHVKAIALRSSKVFCSPEIPSLKDEFVSFLNLFKTSNVNLPLIELIEKVPKHTNFLNEMVARRKKVKVGEEVNLSASCNVIISKQVPQKLKDLRSFTILIKLSSIHFNRAQCNLGANINLMP